MNPGAHENTIAPLAKPATRPGAVPASLTAAFVILMGIALLLYLWNFDAFQFGYNPDSGDYTLLAQALIKGQPYALNYNEVFPKATQFPFGYPLLIIPFVLAAPDNFALPAWLSLTATLVNGTLLFWGWRLLAPGYSDRWRIAVTAMFLLAPTTVVQARQVLSDALFTSFLLATVLITTRLVADPRSRRLWFAFAILAFFMMFTRSIGLVCIAVPALFLAVAFLRERSKRRDLLRGAALTVVTWFLLLGPVLVVTPVTPGDILPTQYLSWYGVDSLFRSPTPPASAPAPTPTPGIVSITPATDEEIPRALRLNLNVIAEHVHRDLRRMLTLTGGGEFETSIAARFKAPWLVSLPGVFAMGLLVLGNVRWWSDTRRCNGITLFQALGVVYLTVTILWAGGGDRLFYPIQPQLYFATLLAIYTCWQLLLRAVGQLIPRFAPHFIRRLAVGGLALLLVGWLALAVYRNLTLPTSYQAWGNLDRRTEWVNANLPADAIVLTDWPVRDFLVTGRQTVEIPRNVRSPDVLEKFLQEHRVTHLLVSLDDALQIEGIAPYSKRSMETRPVLRELLERGVLVRIHSDSFPILVLRVVP